MNMKKDFIIDQVLVNSIGAAFQHAGVYVGGLDTLDPRKKELRTDLRERLIALGDTYKNPVDENKHCQNVEKLAKELTTAHKDKGLLRNDRFRIGIAQKALNLYLKYLWCLDEIPEPPHCPIDREIIKVLSIPWKERDSYNWTQLDDLKKYKELIGMCKDKAEGSVAEWELKEWNSK